MLEIDMGSITIGSYHYYGEEESPEGICFGMCHIV